MSEQAKGPTVLSERESLDLVAGLEIGRLAWVDPELGLAIIPVNFAVEEGRIVVRLNRLTAERVAMAHQVAFEADDVELATHSGWSVLLHGHAEVVVEEHEAAFDRHLIASWAGGERDTVVHVTIERVTGRRLEVRPGGVFVVHMAP